MKADRLYLLVNNQAYRQYFDSTGKAPEDIEHILLDAGVRHVESACCDTTNSDGKPGKAKGYVTELSKAFRQARNIARLSDGSVLIYQHPSVFFGNYFPVISIIFYFLVYYNVYFVF